MLSRPQAGRFYGEIDGSVMTTLIRMGMFKRVSLFDYQAMCKMNSHSVSSAPSAHKKKGDILQPCDTEYPSFVYEPSVKETNSIIKCGRCQKMFVVQQIPESNLLMLVVQADCDCSRQYPPITMQPKEVKYIL
ncbi:Voltage-dependent calcium channel subunit alpha-2/delta-4 [Collichthys lucidus]|uniref:Voltage-dependent calcium channel subunit alpha-2/delta-4 n=1 Tax=Collichthys lucidus TaxID=240159 RepID=A0A4U5VR06_COLLU|nr:Voltage-dependent calcium channel subunit alpha-2/delta-4 [Collichthys lucidus]